MGAIFSATPGCNDSSQLWRVYNSIKSTVLMDFSQAGILRKEEREQRKSGECPSCHGKTDNNECISCKVLYTMAW